MKTFPQSKTVDQKHETFDGQPGKQSDQRLSDQHQNRDRGFVTITVDGNEYRVRAGTHSMNSLARSATLVNPPNLMGVKALRSRKGESFSNHDNINIEGGEVFTSSTAGQGVQAGPRAGGKRANTDYPNDDAEREEAGTGSQRA